MSAFERCCVHVHAGYTLRLLLIAITNFSELAHKIFDFSVLS